MAKRVKDPIQKVEVFIQVTYESGKKHKDRYSRSTKRNGPCTWAIMLNKTFGMAKNRIVDKVYPYMMDEGEVLDGSENN